MNDYQELDDLSILLINAGYELLDLEEAECIYEALQVERLTQDLRVSRYRGIVQYD